MAALFGCITVSNAQSTLVATLSHGSDVSMFYGTYALRDAHEQAESGDIINLSDGAFQAVDITKAITLRGAGISTTKPTFIVNDFGIEIPSDDANRFTMEGIRCTGTMNVRGSFKDPSFSKCQYKGVDINCYYDEGFIENAMFANCKITDFCNIYHGTIQFVNSYLTNCYRIYDGSGATYLNCVMNQYDLSLLSASQLYNCILFWNEDYTSGYRLPNSSMAYNCVAVNFDSPYADLTSSPGCTTATFNEVFKNFTGKYDDNQTFELISEAQKSYLGIDGTQVGLYGGVLSFTTIPSYPQFTKMDVAGKTTTDGKLSVDIEIGAGQ